MIFKISYSIIKAKPFSTLLNLTLFSTGIFIISILLLAQKQFTEQAEKNLAEVSLVAGAKGSPLQLILSSLYHIDTPTGNIPLSEAEELTKNPLVKQAIPISLGDNYYGFRIVGTNTDDFVDLYHGEISEGDINGNDFQVVIGNKVARHTGLKYGDKFSGVHGLTGIDEGHHHEFYYQVSGILKKTGTVLDQLIITNLNSVWLIHSHEDTHKDYHESERHEEHEGHNHELEHEDMDNHEIFVVANDYKNQNHEEGDKHVMASSGSVDHNYEKRERHVHTEECDHENDHNKKEITSLLIKYRSPMSAVALPRLINETTNMQAAAPAIELSRLYSLIGIGVDVFNLIAVLIIFISGFSIFISLFNSLKERQFEVALMRVLGGARPKLFVMIALEGLFIALGGFLTGSLLSRLTLFIVYEYYDIFYTFNSFINFVSDFYLLAASIVVGFMAAMFPAVKAMKTDISETLTS